MSVLYLRACSVCVEGTVRVLPRLARHCDDSDDFRVRAKGGKKVDSTRARRREGERRNVEPQRCYLIRRHTCASVLALPATIGL